MLSPNQHSDRVYALAQEKSGAASSPIAASWRRCLTKHGLNPETDRGPVRLTESEFREVLGRSGHIVEEASGELDWLFGMVGKAGCCLVFTDSDGSGHITATDDAVILQGKSLADIHTSNFI